MLGQEVLDTIMWTAVVNLAAWSLVAFLVFGVWRTPVYHPFAIYLLYHFLGFVVRPLTIPVAGISATWEWIGFTPEPVDVIWTCAVSNLALLATVFGIVLGTRKGELSKRIAPTRLHIRRPAPFYFVAGVLLVLGMMGLYFAFGTLGTGAADYRNIQTEVVDGGGSQLVGGSGYLTAPAEFLPALCIVLVFSTAPRWIAWPVTGLFVAVRFLAGAGRGRFVSVLAAVFLGYLVKIGRRAPTFAVIVGILFGAVAFDIIGSQRLAARQILAGEAELSQVIANYVDKRQSGPIQLADTSEYEVATAAIMVVRERSGYSYFTQYLRIFVWPIPRQLWEDKPVFTSTVRLSDYGYQFYPLTPSVYADLFMALGPAAVVLGMGLLGFVMAKAMQFARTTRRPVVYLGFWVFLVNMIFILRDGNVAFVFYFGTAMIAVAALCLAGNLALERLPFGQRRGALSRASGLPLAPNLAAARP